MQYLSWLRTTRWPKYARIVLSINVVALLGLLLFLKFLIPMPVLQMLPLTFALAYFGIAAAIGVVASWILVRPVVRWQQHDQSTDIWPRLISIPLHQSLICGSLWFFAALFLGLGARSYDPNAATVVFVSTFLVAGGVTLLVALRCSALLRPLLSVAFPQHQLHAATTLEHAPFGSPATLSLYWRMVFTWFLTTATPIVGILFIVWACYTNVIPGTLAEIIPAIAVLAAVALVTGFWGNRLVASSIVDPIHELRYSIDAVHNGDPHPVIHIYDGSEIGNLQADFNDMLTGLQERQRIQELFGRYVGTEVAKAALQQQPTLGGQARTVSVLFVDIIGSTSFAVSYPPEVVVSTLNDFFERVVRIVHAHHGVINKFEGDAALIVFGAPLELDDATSHALQAARELHHELADMRLQAGIGVATGHVVAGHIGAQERFEYTVIGDAVNTAARLTEIAKTTPGQVLTNASTLHQASQHERRHWTVMKSVELRGRNMLTQLARPLRPTLAESGAETTPPTEASQ